jgi:uncharacterized protein with ParB-like and HNH nuclease domain
MSQIKIQQYESPLDKKIKKNIYPLTFKELFKQPKIKLPLFQRRYCWIVQKQISTLWSDIIKFYEDHHYGKIYFIEKKPLLCLDGQQRITAVLLLLCSLRDYSNNIKDQTEETIKFTKKINEILFSDLEKYESIKSENDVDKTQ